MKIYLAARFARKAEMQGVRDVLVGMGHEVTSRWIDSTEPYDLVNSTLDSNPGLGAYYAAEDLEDMRDADAVMYFSQGGPGMGGRFVEWGYCMAMGKRLILIGPRENIFFCFEDVEQYSNWALCLAALADASGWPAYIEFRSPT